jgi:hypothetical protein
MTNDLTTKVKIQSGDRHAFVHFTFDPTPRKKSFVTKHLYLHFYVQNKQAGYILNAFN